MTGVAKSTVDFPMPNGHTHKLTMSLSSLLNLQLCSFDYNHLDRGVISPPGLFNPRPAKHKKNTV